MIMIYIMLEIDNLLAFHQQTSRQQTGSVLALVFTTKELKHKILFNIIDDDGCIASSDYELGVELNSDFRI
jgi:hypothetical protein